MKKFGNRWISIMFISLVVITLLSSCSLNQETMKSKTAYEQTSSTLDNVNFNTVDKDYTKMKTQEAYEDMYSFVYSQSAKENLNKIIKVKGLVTRKSEENINLYAVKIRDYKKNLFGPYFYVMGWSEENYENLRNKTIEIVGINKYVDQIGTFALVTIPQNVEVVDAE